MAYSTVVDATIITTVDCQKQVRSWRLLRSLAELLIPTCNCTTFVDNIDKHEIERDQDLFLPKNYYSPKPVFLPCNIATITGTIFGSPKGKVHFCIQTNPKSASPTLLLELAIPTTTLAKEMRGGHLRIALVANLINGGNGALDYYKNNSCSLLSTSAWTTYCNGRKVGFAIRRRASKADTLVLRHMEPVVVGAGIISRKELEQYDDEIMYLRGNFKRVRGDSANSETFHLIDPEGIVGQELSIFFLRSR